MSFHRASGVLLHPTSLPAAVDIGDFGPGAFDGGEEGVELADVAGGLGAERVGADQFMEVRPGGRRQADP